MSWGKVSGAAGYEVQAAVLPSFDGLLFDVTTTNNRYVPIANLPAGEVFWRVRSVPAAGAKSAWTTEQISIEPSAAPEPLSPVGGTPLAQPDDPALLTWSAVAGATGYDIEVDSDGDWINPSSYSATGTSFLIPDPQPAVTWFWRVRAQRGGGLVTLWSDPASYVVGPLDDVEIDPEMDQSTPVEDVALDWLPVPGATKYEVQVGLDQDFNNLVETKTVFSTRYSPVTTYDNDQYFWRVRAIDAAGTKMAWPGGLDYEPFEFQRNWPEQPTLLHPADTLAPTTGDPFYYQWTPVPHATRYELQVGSDPNFSPSTFHTCSTASTTYAAGLDACMPSQGMVTYWRTRALDAPQTVEGIYSGTHKFVYDSGPVTLTDPANGASVGVPTLTWQASREALTYFVEIRDKNDAVAASATTYSLSWTPEGTTKLDPAKSPFTWTVQAIDSNNSRSPKYPGRSFSLTGVMPTTGAPALTPLTGINNSATTRFPALSWEPNANAAYYRIQIGVAGSGFWLNTTTSHILGARYPFPAATDTDDYFLTPGSYDWRVQALDAGGASLGFGPVDTFQISNLADVTGQEIALDGLALDAGQGCTDSLAEEEICLGVSATPVLDWDPVPGAAFYMVYLANDRELTNRIFTAASTTNTRWTPTSNMAKEALADNQAGQSYYWIIRPCKAPNACSPDPVSTHASATNAFRKVSPEINGMTAVHHPDGDPDSNTQADDITFEWEDYLVTNDGTPSLPVASPSHQTAQKYRIEISQSSTFATTVDAKEVDQSTYTPFDGTLPEGALYWRVQAIDAEGNHLNWGDTREVTKASGTVELSSPFDDVHVGGDTAFRWQPKDFAASYTIEVYKNDNGTFSSANRVFSGTSKQTAYVWTKFLPASADYQWRVRWTDGDAHAGAWSTTGRFSVSPGVVTQTSPTSDAYQPAAGPYFTWQPVQSASKYLLEARKDGSTSSSVRITTVAQAAATTATLEDAAYEWRVTAYDPSNGVLAQSAWRPFKIDGTRPTVTKKAPLTAAKRGANFTATFSEPVSGLSSATMRLYVAGRTTPLPAKVTLSVTGRKATLNPAKSLVKGKSYTVRLRNTIRDLAGNALVATKWKVTASR